MPWKAFVWPEWSSLGRPVRALGWIGQSGGTRVVDIQTADTAAGPPTVDPPTIRVLVVAGVRLYREGLATNLASRKNFAVVGTAACLDDVLAQLRPNRPDVVVLDMGTPENFPIVQAIRAEAAHVKTVAVAIEEVDRDVLACAEAGVAGYVPYDRSIDELVAVIESVTRGELLCSPRMAATLFRRLAAMAGEDPERAKHGLTARERQIVPLIDAGLSNKEIAQSLSIEVATVKNHVHNILDKLQVCSRAEAAARLRRGAATVHPPRIPSTRSI
jgi:two-component system nitrate/nitrite response regulator NarL